MRILLAEPRGFCAGVERAIEIVETALGRHGAPIYVHHDIVHNRQVVQSFRERGVVFVEEIRNVPPGAVLIFSAHGVAQAVRTEADGRRLLAIDATCPLVTKVHREATRFHAQGYEILLIGHRGHPEVVGTMGQLPAGAVHLIETEEDARAVRVRAPGRVAYLTQTTLNIDDVAGIIAVLRGRFPDLAGPTRDDICYATNNRQAAVKELSREADLVLVLGSPSSSNSNRLREVAQECGRRAMLIEGPEDLAPDAFDGVQTVAITAGASTPEVLVQRVVDHLRRRFGATVETRKVVDEKMHFPLPPEMQATGR
ncbi:MAG: 4-hydroxy-3-methylbut-2-enyl diphosphate reductase [Planctomycetes bacterium]|nr:4-hydroxy-3-methylbut-2-enyl diphosphate reductase [Planctomycetota bacterium]